MRTSPLFFALLLCGGCDVTDYDLGPGFFSDTPPPASAVVTAACGPSPTPLAQVPNLQRGPLEIVPGALYVVGTDDAGATTDETLWRVPMRGGAPVAVALNQVNIASISGQSPLTPTDAVPDGGLVWTAAGADDAGFGGTIWELNAAGQPAVWLPNRLAPGPIAFDDGVAFWVEQGTDPDGGQFGALMQASTSDIRAPTILEKTAGDRIPRAFALLLSSRTWAWVTNDPAYDDAAHSVAVSTTARFPFGEQTEVAGLDGGGVAALAPSSGGAGFFFSTPSGIMSVSPPDPPELVVPLIQFVSGLVDYDGALYFVEPMTGNLWAYPDQIEAGTGPLKQLAYGVDPLTSLGADDRCLYWLDPLTSSVMMVQR